MVDLTYRAPLDDMTFALHSVGGQADILALPPFADFDAPLIHSILEEGAKFAAHVISPLNRGGDLQGSTIDAQGHVTLPDGFVDAYHQFVEQGWNAAAFPMEIGGQGLPSMAATALQEMFHGANLSFALMPLLTHSAVHLLRHYGTDFDRTHILPKLVTGEWTGVMCLTEPQAGSDVGACRTRAIPQKDGSYRLKGAKIYISCGDHDASGNIIHMVLARLPDAPEGTRGLSLFMVPKLMVNEDGSVGDANDVKAVSLEHKLGMHATPTCVMAYGDSDDGAYATIVGKPGEGLKAMFIMMNAARIAVGLEGLGIAQYATQLATDYAAERVQGRPLASDTKQDVTINQHRDVQRMLLWMQSHTSALRALAIYAARQVDLASHNSDEAAQQRLDLLTPVVKAHTTNLAFQIASEAIQVFGGLGYIEETGIAQLLRDVRVSMIYEGTNGIQALDLAKRKVGMDKGAALTALLAEMSATADHLTTALPDAVTPFTHALDHLREAGEAIQKQVAHTMSNQEGAAPFGASAVPFQTLLGLVVEGWLLAQEATEAQRLLDADGSTFSHDFLKEKIRQANYFIQDCLLEVESLKKRVLLGDSLL